MIELLVVIAISTILAALLLPSLAQAKEKSHTLGCLSNLKQLELCWHLYAVDNQDLLPPNDSVMSFSGSSLARSVSWCPDHARTDTNSIDLESGVLFPYNRSVAIYHCPADQSTVESPAGEPLSRLRNRSYNMSQSVNGYPEYLSDLNQPGLSSLPAWKKLCNIIRPPPASLFVFVDEHEQTLIDAQFGNPVGMPYYWDIWFDLPANRHNQGACLSFADGHAERWRWVEPKIFQAFGQAPAASELPDYRRIQQAMKQWSDNS